MTLLAWALQWLGRYEEAQTHLDRALAIQEEVLGPDHIETAYVLYRLGWQYRLLGEYQAARDCYERALPIIEKARGPDDPWLAQYLADLGVVQADLGDASAATQNYRRALAIREKVLGPDHPHVAQILNKAGGSKPFDVVDERRFQDFAAKMGVILESWGHMAGHDAARPAVITPPLDSMTCTGAGMPSFANMLPNPPR